VLLLVHSRLASVWFEPSFRATAQSLGSCASALGVLLASIEGWLVTESEQVPKLLRYEAICATVIFLACVIYLPNVPPTAPSRSTEEQDKSERNDQNENGFCSSLAIMWNQSSFVRLAIGCGLVRGLHSGWIVQCVFLLEPVGFTQGQLTYVSIIGFSVAMMVGVFLGRLIDVDPRKMKSFILAEIGISIVSFGLFFTLVVTKHQSIPLVVILLLLTIYVALIRASMPHCLEFGKELSYPVLPHYGTSVISACDHIIAAISMMIAPSFSFISIHGTLLVLSVLGWFIVLSLKETFARSDLDRSPVAVDGSDKGKP